MTKKTEDPNAGIEFPPGFSEEPKPEEKQDEPKTDEKQPEPPVIPPPAKPPIITRNTITKWSDALLALPKSFSELQVESRRATIELGFATQIVRASEHLQKCDPKSIYDAVIFAARIGITLSPALGLCYLVPRKGKCCLDIGYKGWRATLVSYGALLHISGHVVYEGEEFSWRPDLNELVHIPISAASEAEQKSRKILAAYSRAILPSGLVVFEVIPGWELEKIKSVSAASRGFSPYTDWQGEMTRKAPIKRHSKMLQVLQNDARIAAMFENEQRNDSLNEQSKPKIASRWDTDFTEAEVM